MAGKTQKISNYFPEARGVSRIIELVTLDDRLPEVEKRKALGAAKELHEILSKWGIVKDKVTT